MPRPEKRLPQEVLSVSQIERLLAVANVSDPLGIRDRAMLELFYSTGMRRIEFCRVGVHASSHLASGLPKQGKRVTLTP